MLLGETGGISLGWQLWGRGAGGSEGSRQCQGYPAIKAQLSTVSWALHITPHLKHLVDSFSCLCRCLEVKEAPALCPEPPLAFVHAAVLGAVDLEQDKRQGSELGQGLQQEEQRSNSGKSGWRGCVYAEGMEAAWKGSTENAMKRPRDNDTSLDPSLTDPRLKPTLKQGLQSSSHTWLALPYDLRMVPLLQLQQWLWHTLGTCRGLRAGNQDHATARLPTNPHLVRADNEDNILHVPMGTQLLLHLGQPHIQRIKGLLLPNVIDQDDSLCVLVKLIPHLWGQKWKVWELSETPPV